MLATLQTLLNNLRITPTETEKIDLAKADLEAASDWVKKYLDRGIEYTEGIEESVRAYGWPKLLLGHYPIIQINEVKVDGKPVEDFTVLKDKGILYRAAGWPPSTTAFPTKYSRDSVPGTEDYNVTVNYDAGYVTKPQAEDDPSLTPNLPGDLERCVLFVAATFYRQHGADMRVRRSHLLKSGTWYATEEFRSNVQMMIGHYRRL